MFLQERGHRGREQFLGLAADEHADMAARQRQFGVIVCAQLRPQSARGRRRDDVVVQRIDVQHRHIDVAEIDAAYDAEVRRGAQPRYFEDVTIGDELQPRVKGPLTTTDVVVWHVGWGMQLTPPGAFSVARACANTVVKVATPSLAWPAFACARPSMLST